MAKKQYTRKMEREFDHHLFENATLNESNEYILNRDSINNANNYLVGAIFDLTPEQVDELKPSEFQQKLKEALKIKAEDSAPLE